LLKSSDGPGERRTRRASLMVDLQVVSRLLPYSRSHLNECGKIGIGYNVRDLYQGWSEETEVQNYGNTSICQRIDYMYVQADHEALIV
jgi:NADH/NAD ratio-sensing transcriptional regulator Rex